LGLNGENEKRQKRMIGDDKAKERVTPKKGCPARKLLSL
jgi:hypothetical protein